MGFPAVLPIFPGGKEAGAGVALPLGQPEAVHEVVIRPERRKLVGGLEATKDRQGNVIRENLPHPRGEAGLGLGSVKKQDEEDERAENLCLVYGRPSVE